jgi:hypothetical protein
MVVRYIVGDFLKERKSKEKKIEIFGHYLTPGLHRVNKPSTTVPTDGGYEFGDHRKGKRNNFRLGYLTPGLTPG